MLKIWVKYEQLDSGECGAVGIPAFNAEASSEEHQCIKYEKFMNTIDNYQK